MLIFAVNSKKSEVPKQLSEPRERERFSRQKSCITNCSDMLIGDLVAPQKSATKSKCLSWRADQLLISLDATTSPNKKFVFLSINKFQFEMKHGLINIMH